TNEVRCYTPESLPGLRKKYIFNVDPGPRPHTFWVGYRQGGANLLVLEDPEAPYFEEPNFSPYELGTEALYQTTEDTEGTQWLATSNGLYAYSPQDQTTKAFLPVTGDSLSLSTNRLFSVLHDRKGRLWVGTRNGGLCVRQTTDGKTSFRCFRYDENDPGSLPSDMVLHVNEDAQGRIWISNPEALAVYLEDGTFRTFGLADGLPYTICYGTFEDQQGNFWAAFGGNFAQIELTDAGDFKLRKVITRNEGLAGQANAQYGWSSLPDGRLALSQRDGLNIFLPSEVGEDNYFPPIILTEFELFDHPVGTSPSPQDKVAPQFLLEDDINRLQKINLPAGQDFISLTFSAPEYRPNRTTFYSYRIAGIQDEWTDTNGRNYLSFPKLPPGDYLLELRTGDERERWSEEVRTLGISLAAPWYQRWWALLLFGLA
ncbi:MAG: triple tyrosine motif-containing protein, partial [Bacteroidota bacterium]